MTLISGICNDACHTLLIMHDNAAWQPYSDILLPSHSPNIQPSCCLALLHTVLMYKVVAIAVLWQGDCLTWKQPHIFLPASVWAIVWEWGSTSAELSRFQMPLWIPGLSKQWRSRCHREEPRSFWSMQVVRTFSGLLGSGCSSLVSLNMYL